MKCVFSLFFVLSFLQISFGQNNNFYSEILNFRDCENCYFVLVDVESEPYIGETVIENDDLFAFFNTTKSFDRTMYENFMNGFFQKKQVIYIENGILESNFFLSVEGVSKKKFRIVKDEEEVDKAAGKGCSDFINYYFVEQSSNNKKSETKDCKEIIINQKGSLFLNKPIFDIRKQTAIIKYLYKWQIPTRIDELSGLLVIDKNAVKRTSKLN